jgi:hypothetical protein
VDKEVSLPYIHFMCRNDEGPTLYDLCVRVEVASHAWTHMRKDLLFFYKIPVDR